MALGKNYVQVFVGLLVAGETLMIPCEISAAIDAIARDDGAFFNLHKENYFHVK